MNLRDNLIKRVRVGIYETDQGLITRVHAAAAIDALNVVALVEALETIKKCAEKERSALPTAVSEMNEKEHGIFRIAAEYCGSAVFMGDVATKALATIGRG